MSSGSISTSIGVVEVPDADSKSRAGLKPDGLPPAMSAIRVYQSSSRHTGQLPSFRYAFSTERKHVSHSTIGPSSAIASEFLDRCVDSFVGVRGMVVLDVSLCYRQFGLDDTTERTPIARLLIAH